MLRTRCPYCGRPFSISREEAGVILTQAIAENARYGMRECPFCRRLVKIGLAELRRVAPAPATIPAQVEERREAPPSPAPPSEMEAPASPEEAAVEPTSLELSVPAIQEEPHPAEAPAEPPRRRRGKQAGTTEAVTPASKRTRTHKTAGTSPEEKPKASKRRHPKEEA
ncbi:MAG TPA: hypothetical protein VNK89_12380 [Thermoflexus sp.]|nr:hypothetical protein [Thermoflexus sp.]